jgi:flagellar hook assembly protein FlgD
VYRNSGGANPTFSDVGAGLTGVDFSSVAWADYDNDGDLDILLTGFTGSARIAKLYQNSGGPNPTFSEVTGLALDGVSSSSVAWGDYDNDGAVDILLTGFTGTARITKLYRNIIGANPPFSNTGAVLANVQSSSVAWGDFDNDGDLDILLTGYDTGNIPTSKLYRSDGAVVNTPPNAPGGLSTMMLPSGGTSFNWNAASDAQTPAAALSYNLRVGTTPGGNEISSSMAAAGGYRTVVQLGNAQKQTAWTLRLPPGTYYWSVQAVDGAFAGSPFAAEQSFAPVRFIPQTLLEDLIESTGAWGDYDNDGDLDVLLTGYSLFFGSYVSRVYRNDGGGAFATAASLSGAGEGSVAWGDYDNDGDLDILLTGWVRGPTAMVGVSKVYRNNGDGTFTDIAANLTGAYSSSVAWGDYDNDGDLDILLTGNSAPVGQPVAPVSRIYRNDGGGVFQDIGAGLSGVLDSAAAWGDYDNDGDLDIVLAGAQANSTLISKVYRNDGNGIFTDVVAGLTGVQAASAAWGDYDNDGDLDILLAGEDASHAGVSKIYQNAGNGTFLPTGALPNTALSPVAWGDYDNDGDLDVLAIGSLGATVFRSSGGLAPTFSAVYPPVCSSPGGGLAWGDYDNDGDLDVLATESSSTNADVYRSEGAPPDGFPSPPGNLSAVRNGGLVTFSWTAASDDHTPASGLSYNLRVGSSPTGDQWMPAMAAANGYRRVARLGNAQERTSWTVALPPGPCYWNVQAIDGAFLGSAFAAGPTVAVEEAAEVPASLELGAPSPNPFTTEVSLNFALPQEGRVELAVFDAQGRRVRVLLSAEMPAGRHSVHWDGRDESGARQGNGIYLVRMNAAEHTWTRKLVLAR